MFFNYVSEVSNYLSAFQITFRNIPLIFQKFLLRFRVFYLYYLYFRIFQLYRILDKSICTTGPKTMSFVRLSAIIPQILFVENGQNQSSLGFIIVKFFPNSLRFVANWIIIIDLFYTSNKKSVGTEELRFK